MARTAHNERTLTSEEQRLIRYYVREGATEDMLPKAARKAKMTLEKAQHILGHIAVREEIERRKNYLIYEQARIDAQDLNRREEKEDERVEILNDRIYAQLNKLIDADPMTLTNGHKLKADFLKLALVVTGTIRDGRTERLIPPEGSTPNTGPQMFQSDFENGSQRWDQDAAPLFPDESAPVASDQPQAIPVVASSEPPAETAPAPASAGKKKSIFTVPVKRS